MKKHQRAIHGDHQHELPFGIPTPPPGVVLVMRLDDYRAAGGARPSAAVVSHDRARIPGHSPKVPPVRLEAMRTWLAGQLSPDLYREGAKRAQDGSVVATNAHAAAAFMPCSEHISEHGQRTIAAKALVALGWRNRYVSFGNAAAADGRERVFFPPAHWTATI
jgi:hypothetical protein